MPGPVVSKYLTQHLDKGFNEVVTVFRHDFVQFMGMLHSWMVMIDGELMLIDEETIAKSETTNQFRSASAELQVITERIFNETQTHLRPQLDPTEIPDRISYIFKTWDQFYADFGVYATGELDALEKQMRQLVTHSEFDALIEKPFSPMAQGDSIKDLVVKPFSRIRDLLDVSQFDARIAQALGKKDL